MKLRSQAAARISRVLAVVVALLIVSQSFLGQQRGGSLRIEREIALHAVLQPTANLNPQSVRICEELPTNPGGTIVLLELHWNASSSTREIQIVASFPNAQHAFEDDRGHSIDAAQWQFTIDEQAQKSFPSRSDGMASSLLVATERMHELGRQGKKVHKIELRFHGDNGNVVSSRYCGLLQFRINLQ